MDFVLWGSVFLAGLFSFFSPCVLPLFPVYFGVLMSEQDGPRLKIGRLEIYWKPMIRTVIFIAGISTVFFFLGFAATALGSLIYNPWFNITLGVVIVLLGLHQMEMFHLLFLQKQKTVQFEVKDKKSLWSSYLLGLSFSFGWTPCVGPVLSAVLTLISTQQASITYGIFLLCLYILGLAIPFLILSAASTVAFKWFNLAKKRLLFSTLLLGACQNSQMGMDTKDMKETTEMMSSMSGEKMDNMSSKDEKMDKKMGEMDDMTQSTFTTLDGKEVSLADYKGKKVYLKFWASWCPICLAGLADINQLADMPPKDAVVLTVIAPGVNREKNLDDFKEWFSGLEYKTLPVLVDNNGQFLKKLGIVGYPSSAFIDANGKVVRVQPGHVTNEDIVKTLETL